jgi:acetyl esterase
VRIAVPIDPEVRGLLNRLDSAGALTPFNGGTASEARKRYRALSMARRGPDYVPEAVGGVENRNVPGPAGSISVRVYQPTVNRGGVVTYFHGGGWVVGDLDTHDPGCRRIANLLGATVVSVEYRLAPEDPYPAALEDAVAAAQSTAETFPDQPHVVAGDSAGAALAVGVALRARDAGRPELAAALLFYPPTDPTMSMPSVRENGEGYFLTSADMAWFIDQYVPDLTRRTEPPLDLLGADLVGLPPTVIATAEFDPLRDEGAAFAQRLLAAGVTVRHLEGPGLIHGYLAFSGAVAAAGAHSSEAIAALDALLLRA